MQNNLSFRFEAIIFDIDGTLASTNRLIFASFNYVMKKYANKTLTDEEIIALFGPPEDIILKQYFNSKYEVVRKDYYDFYRRNHDSMVTRFKGMETLVTELSEQNMNLGIFTGKGRDSSLITLSWLGIHNCFDMIVTGDDVQNHKPSGEGITKLLNKFDVAASNSLMIGDAPSDITAAREAGCKVAVCLWDSYAKEKIVEMKPDYVLDTIDRLKSVLIKSK